MRGILAIALALFGLALAYQLAPRFGSGVGDSPRAADRALEIVAVAHGALLPAARLAGHLDEVDDSIRVGERLLVGDGRSGVRTVAFMPGAGLLTERHFDVRDAEQAEALRASVEAAAIGEVLVLASSGHLRLPGSASGVTAELQRALETLGAAAVLGSTAPESWAMIALRGRRGWTPLAEAHSIDSGVAVTFVLGSEYEPRGFRGDFAHVRAQAQGELELTRELAWADRLTPGVRVAPEARLRGRPLAGIALRPLAGPDGAEARLGWDAVLIAPGGGFMAWLGMRADGGGEPGIEFTLWVDGEQVGARWVRPGDPWKVFLVDLRDFAGRKVSLELRARTVASAPGELLVGRPMLLRGYERSPLEVWAER